jgi:hypothetical protein
MPRRRIQTRPARIGQRCPIMIASRTNATVLTPLSEHKYPRQGPATQQALRERSSPPPEPSTSRQETPTGPPSRGYHHHKTATEDSSTVSTAFLDFITTIIVTMPEGEKKDDPPKENPPTTSSGVSQPSPFIIQPFIKVREYREPDNALSLMSVGRRSLSRFDHTLIRCQYPSSCIHYWQCLSV